jgi:Bacterial Ig domain/RTX calcium-binding nonapeptide repeat (4 copies)
VTRIVLAALAALFLLPGTAAAATLTNSGGTLTYTGGAGSHASDVDVGQQPDGTVQVQPQPDDADPITAVSGCTASAGTYDCAGVARISASLGDGNDVFELQGIGGIGGTWVTLPFTATGGSGDDIITGGTGGARLDGGAGDDSLGASGGTNTFIGGAGDDVLGGGPDTDTYIGGAGIDRAAMFEPAVGDAAITIDGRANDGVAAEHDNVAADVENVSVLVFDLSPPSVHVTIVGNAAGNQLDAPDEPSTLIGGAGDDVLNGGAYADTILARDGYADRVYCGGGGDTAVVDTLDQVSATCEHVQVAAVGNATEDHPPTVAWIRPTAGSHVNANRGATLRVNAADDHGVAQVRFLDDARVVCVDRVAPFTCRYRPRGGDVGRDTLTAVAVDGAGQTASAVRSVRVARFSPRRLTLSRHGTIASGRLRLPARVSRRLGCRGTVTVRGAGASRRARVSKRCTYRVRMPFAASVRARFGGNAVLRPARAG